MKKILLWLPLFYSALAFAQGVYVGPQVALRTVNGVSMPLAGATITVCGPNASGIPCSPVLVNTIFKDAALSQPLSNPFPADANGNYSFAAAPSTYTVTVSASGFVGQSYQVSAGAGINAYVSPGVFTNTQMNDYLTSDLGGATTAGEFTFDQTGFATEGIGTAVAVPSTATAHGVFGVAAYVKDNCNSAGSSQCNAVAGYFQARNTVNGAAIWGTNPVLQDAAGLSGHAMKGEEIDINILGSPTYVNGIQFIGAPVTGTFPGAPSLPYKNFNQSHAAVLDIDQNNTSVSTWPVGMISSDGAINGPILESGAKAYTGASDAQPLELVPNNGSSALPVVIAGLHAAPSGSCPTDPAGNNAVTFGINGAAASLATALYGCYPGGTWAAFGSGGGSGNVSNTGTPTAGQFPLWTNATTLSGNTLGQGNWLVGTSSVPISQIKQWIDVRDTSVAPAASADFCAALNAAIITAVANNTGVDASNPGAFATGLNVYCNSNPFAGIANLPTIHYGTYTITTSVTWSTTDQPLDMEGDVSSILNGTVIKICNATAGHCGPGSFPLFPGGGVQGVPLGGPLTPTSYSTGTFTSTGTTTLTGSGTTWTSAMVGGFFCQKTAGKCTKGGNAGVVVAVPNSTTITLEAATIPSVAGASYTIQEPNVFPLIWDGGQATGSTDGTQGNCFGHKWSNLTLDTNGFANAVALYSTNCQERSNYDTVKVVHQASTSGSNSAAAVACYAFDRSFTYSNPSAAHWHVTNGQCDNGVAPTNSTSYGAIVEYGIMDGTGTLIPNSMTDGNNGIGDFGTIVGHSGSVLQAAIWLDGLENFDVKGVHCEWDTTCVEVGQNNPTSAHIEDVHCANMTGNKCVWLHANALSNVVQQIESQTAMTLLQDDAPGGLTINSTNCASGGGFNTTCVLPQYNQPNGGTSYFGAIVPTSVTASGPVASGGAGSNAGQMVLPGNTAVGALPANTFSWLGPNSASFTAWAIQLMSSIPNAKQIPQFGTPASGTIPLNGIDFPQPIYAPAADCVNAVAGSGWSTGATPAALCRAGTNNKDALLSPWGASDVGYFKIHLPKDWDSAASTDVSLDLTSTDATNGHTIIMQVASACAKGDGSTTDDVAFNTAQSFSTITLNGNANRTWTATLTGITNTGCAAQGILWLKVSRTTDTATNVGVYGATVDVPRLLTVQAQ